MVNDVATVLFCHHACQQLLGDAFQEGAMPPVRREGCAELMVAEGRDGVLAVGLPVAVSGPLHLRVRRYVASTAQLDDRDQHATDDRRSVPRGEGSEQPIENRKERVHGCRL